MDAVLNWGDNPSASSTGGNGPDNLRIIFTSSTTGTNPSPANSQDGLEVARFFPGTDTTYTYLTSIPSYTTSNTNYISHGRMGVGDFTNQGINENTPKQKLDVIGNARLRFLPDNLFKADSLVNKYVMVDSLGVLRWADANLSSGFGSNCSDSINSKFTTHRHVDLNQFNFYFKGKGGIPNYNSVGIGYNCGENLIAKFNVRQKDTLTVSVNTTAGYFLNNDITNSLSRTYIGVQGVANGNHPLNLRSTNIGGDFIADSADVNYGVRGIARSGLTSTGGYFDANGNSNTNFGIRAYASNGTISNVGVYTSIQATAPIFNYGVFGQIQGTNSAVNRAGYFNGDLEYTQGLIGSDQMFKTNVDSLSNALDIIRNVMPKTYLFDTAQYSQFNFSARPQYGFIAQEVEQVLPELVHQSYHPGVLDSSNTNYIVQPTNYKSLNYNAFIPINTQAIKELDAQINRVRSEIDTLNTRNDSIRIIRDRETLSDQQLKTNVQTLSGSLNKVRQMRGITYNWNHSANPNLNLDSLTHIGFVAQEVNTVEPLLTFIDDSSYMHVNYQRFVPVLLQSIKELDNQVQQKDSIIQSLDSRLTQLEQLITQCCNAAQNRVNNNSQNEAIAMLEVTLSSKNVVVLNQNVPNPFAEQTSISFQIPDDVKYAQMIFTDNLGKIIKTMDIEQRGKGVITVFADDLSTGVYTYTLIIDGKAIDSKRMIKK